jgi:hypothetical protein
LPRNEMRGRFQDPKNPYPKWGSFKIQKGPQIYPMIDGQPLAMQEALDAIMGMSQSPPPPNAAERNETMPMPNVQPTEIALKKRKRHDEEMRRRKGGT